jgi:PAS domain S-box-containing protein
LNIHNRTTFIAGWSAIEKRLLPLYVWTSDPLTFWRERILFLVCFIAAAFGPIALVPSLLLAYREGLWIVILIDSLAYMATVAILIGRNVSFVVRALVLCFILYALGVCILFILGPGGAGYIWLFGASVLISTFIGLGAAIWTLLFNTITMLSVGIFIAYGNPGWILHVNNALEKWLVMSANFLLLNAVVTITTAFLLNGLKTALLTEQKISKSLRKSEARFQDLFQEAPVGYFEYDTMGRITRVNQTELEMLGYPMEEMIGYPVWKFIVEQETARQQILAKLAGALAPFRGFERTYCRKDGTTFPVLTQDRLMKDEQGNITGIRCAIQDITDRKQAEEKLKQTLESLRKAIGTTIQVMVSAVETRDPYTAGHQIRSAELARAIAAEMGLPQDKIDGIRMAGSIHDIGKLSIPAEILSKPTKLSEIEFSLIKEHANRGYEILKDVESPWPLAEIVYQHHERMDGSGYPRKRKGEEILIEARILSVADVVEAMASHRPYRPALGLNAALEEIEKNRGTHYDKAVADACLRLFREKGYRLAEA